MPELTAEQKAKREQLKTLVGPLVAEIVTEQFAKLREELRGGNGGTHRIDDLVSDAGQDAPPRGKWGRDGKFHIDPTERRGLAAAQFIRCLAASKMLGINPVEFARQAYGEASRPFKALSDARQISLEEMLGKLGQKAALGAQGGAAGGFLLPEELAQEVIEFLRPASAVRTLNPVIMPMDVGTLRVPKLATGASAAYVGENVSVATAQPVFGQVVLTAKKLAALVPISNDLIRRGGPQVDTLIRDDLVAAIAQRSDLAFIRGDGTSGQPKGLLNWVLSAEQVVSQATFTSATTVADLGKAIQALADANVRFIRPGWVMSNRTWRWLYTLLSTTNQFIFRDEMNEGTIFGFPFARTAQIPNNLTPGTASELYFVDFADVVIGETTGILIDVSTEAAYYDGAQVQPTFSLDQMVVRAIVEHDLGLRHNESVAMLTQVLWN
jgi:HK97 family phage major capsid protein